MNDFRQESVMSRDEVRTLYGLYADLAREFVIDLPPLAEMPGANEAGDSSEESLAQRSSWFAEMDRRIPVHQLRQFLQTTQLATDESLSLLLKYHLQKANRDETDRDKIDFLLVQLLADRLPAQLTNTEVDLADVQQALAPAIEAFAAGPDPAELQSLDALLKDAAACADLNHLFMSGVLQKGKKLKIAAAENYYHPAALVAFARFNLSLRRIFFRLMHQELDAILEGLRSLELSGITTLDCRRAQFSAQEPIERLRMICHSWKVMFQAEYAFGQPLRMLVDLHASIQAAIEAAQTSRKSPREAAGSAPPPGLMARAAAAGFGDPERSFDQSGSLSSSRKPSTHRHKKQD